MMLNVITNEYITRTSVSKTKQRMLKESPVADPRTHKERTNRFPSTAEDGIDVPLNPKIFPDRSQIFNSIHIHNKSQISQIKAKYPQIKANHSLIEARLQTNFRTTER